VIAGQDKAVEQFLGAWNSGALHHAWLLAGPSGVGKARFALDAAERVLAEAAGPPVEAPGLDVPEDHPVGRLVRAGSHPDFRLLERIENKSGTALARSISVAQVRALGDLFDMTPALSPWRAVVIDSVDELEKSAANALLKMLEEPPANCLFLLVSHVPGRLLPTIRSRCRRLTLRPLAPDDVARAAADALGRGANAADGADIKTAALASDGSVARALALIGGTGLQVRDRVTTMLAALPAVDPRELHALGDSLGRDESAFTAFVATVRDWLSARVTVAGAEPARLARIADVWERVNASARDVKEYNLERKPLVFNVFGWLAAATRG
jgi:DNA polymerase III subunit delta'